MHRPLSRIQGIVAVAAMLTTLVHDLLYELLGTADAHAHIHSYREALAAAGPGIGITALVVVAAIRLSRRDLMIAGAVGFVAFVSVEMAERTSTGERLDLQLLLVVSLAGVIVVSVPAVDWVARRIVLARRCSIGVPLTGGAVGYVSSIAGSVRHAVVGIRGPPVGFGC